MKSSLDERIIKVIAIVVVSILAALAVFPFITLVMSSFASEHDIINNGYTFFPKEYSLNAYDLVFRHPKRIIDSYKITIFITAFGTAVSLFFSSMAAYVLSRKDVRYRNKIAFFLYFTELLRGGLAAQYIVVSSILDLKNTLAVLVLLPMFSVFNILILRNFISATVPDSLSEAAKIDGANDFKIFIRIILPLSKPALASIGLFTALFYWNDWWTAMLFVEKQNLFPLQYSLYLILSSVNIASNMIENIPSVEMPKESLKLAMTVISTGPIIILYPFVQKYFVKGITLGSVKG